MNVASSSRAHLIWAFWGVLLLTVVLCSGCGLWVSSHEAVSRDDLQATDPYDGSVVYDLHAVVLGAPQQSKAFAEPLTLLERRMVEESPYAVIRAADCGMLACYANDTPLAARALDRAIAISDHARRDESQTEKVKGRSGSEREKVFAGEPHEIATLYLFRGLLYLASNDPENAKSCFLQIALTDSMAKQEQERSNWITADVLATLSFLLYGNGTRASDYIQMIRERYPQSPNGTGWVRADALAELRRENLTIVLVAVGFPPVKHGKGQLAYARMDSRIHGVEVQGSRVWLTDDLCYQAVTRGRRQVDDYLSEREKQKRDAEVAGAIALGIGSAVGGYVGLAVQLIAGAAIDEAQRIDLDADNRHIGAVPGQIYLWASNDLEVGDTLEVRLLNESQKPVASSKVKIPSRAKQNPALVLAWFPR